MKADKKLTIKVKSKTEKRIIDDPEVEMITEWNIKRILLALITFIVIIILPAYYFSSQDDENKAKNDNSPPLVSQPVIKQPELIKEATPEKTDTRNSIEQTIEEPVILVSPVKPVDQTDKEPLAENVVKSEVELQQAPSQVAETEILNPNVIRARLARWVKDKEPHGQVDLPLLVDDTKAEGFYYFTELNNMQGNIVFHEWLKEGNTIYKRKFIIRGQNARMSTSKLFTFRSPGQWQVRLINDQGEVLHKIDFSVENR